jgi:hypothetical protein
MDGASLTGGGFTLRTGASTVPGTVTASGAAATFTPAAPLGSGLTYTATVSTGARDLAGNAVASTRSWSFTARVIDTTPPSVIAKSPQDLATGVLPDATLSLSFSEDLDPASVASTAFVVSDTGSALLGGLSLSGRQLVWRGASPLPLGRRLDVVAGAGIKDQAGNALATSVSWSFTTQAPPDTTPPTVSSTTPVAGATGVTAGTSVTATLSEALDPSSVSAATFTLLRTTDGTAVPATVGASGALATLRPSSPLTTGSYRATLGVGIKDPAGNGLAASFIWSFTVNATVQWATPRILHDHRALASESQLLTTRSGLAVAVWIEEVAAGDQRIHLRRYDPTTGWAPLQIHQDLVKLGAFQAALQEDGTLWTLCNRSKLDGSGLEMVSTTQSLAGTWGAVALLGVPADRPGNEIVLGVDDSGRAFGAWRVSFRGLDGFSWVYVIRMARYLPGTGWEAPNSGELFVQDSPDVRKLILKLNGAGQGVLAWEYWSSDGSTTVMRSILANALAAAPTAIPGTSSRNPAVHLNESGTGTLLYTTYDSVQVPFLGALKAVPFTAAGWGAPIEVYSGADQLPMEPSVAVDATGRILAGWVQAPMSDAQAGSILRAEAAAGGVFSTPVTAQQATSSPGAGTRTLAAVSDSGRALQGWVFFWNGRYRLYSAVRDQGVWGSALPVESKAGTYSGVSGHAMVLDGLGRGLATWVQADQFGNTSIWCSQIP